ncbi:MAG TPA: type IV pilus modification protein PilV [Casimicrobiaceae bacterium]
MRASPSRADAGFTLLEVLITMVILALGLLGLFGLQTKAQKAEIESYQRTQALVLIQDIVDRMNANRADAFSQAYVTASPVGGGGALTDCAGKTGADLDLCEWGNLLKGVAETAAGGSCTTTSGTACIGGMTAAKGCIAYDAATELTDSTGAVQAGTGLYTISIVWEGLSATTLQSDQLKCGTAPYGARMVNSTLRIAALGAQ